MVDYHTRKKISPESDIFFRVWSSIIAPSTEGSMFFIILNDISLVAY